MATKTISITDEAYNILKSKKEDYESFSKAIVKLAGKKKLSSFYGSLSEKSANILEKTILEDRNIHKKKHKKRRIV